MGDVLIVEFEGGQPTPGAVTLGQGLVLASRKTIKNTHGGGTDESQVLKENDVVERCLSTDHRANEFDDVQTIGTPP